MRTLKFIARSTLGAASPAERPALLGPEAASRGRPGIRLFKAAFGGAFLVLTVVGAALPIFGVEFTSAREVFAMGGGGLMGVVTSLRA